MKLLTVFSCCIFWSHSLYNEKSKTSVNHPYLGQLRMVALDDYHQLVLGTCRSFTLNGTQVNVRNDPVSPEKKTDPMLWGILP